MTTGGINKRVIGRIDCPRCGRENVPVMQCYWTYGHANADGSGMACLGADPERVFTAMLRNAQLDVREDLGREVPPSPDPDLEVKQAQRDRETLLMLAYQRREAQR